MIVNHSCNGAGTVSEGVNEPVATQYRTRYTRRKGIYEANERDQGGRVYFLIGSIRYWEGNVHYVDGVARCVQTCINVACTPCKAVYRLHALHEAYMHNTQVIFKLHVSGMDVARNLLGCMICAWSASDLPSIEGHLAPYNCVNACMQ